MRRILFKERQQEVFMANKKSHRQILFLTQFSILLAIEIIVCFTPLGTLPSLGTLSATLSHIPVIITAAILGVKAGALMGLAFGTCSFIYWSFVSPGVYSFIYTPLYSLGEFEGNFGSILICFVPRILIGVVTALVIKALEGKFKRKAIPYAIAGLLGSLTNTLLVLGGVWLFFGQEYYSLVSDGTQALYAILGLTVLTNGLPEAVLGAFACCAIALPVKNIVTKKFLT